ncbi:MAG TPA: sulfatase [Bryobacteraceae bacterium]|jgi:arylsulfatase A|nr:sulfatase [Bryobacteraceae bacterium]
MSTNQRESRRTFLKTAALAALTARARAQSKPPNIVLIYADDLGYGDLSCYGSNIATPNLDRMAADGIRLTHFYSASSVCSPSRAALLTGRYPSRVGVPRVLDPEDPGGLPDSETTMAQMLKRAGYATMCVGKWHLGAKPGFLPTARGFDSYFGIPYSNDMHPRVLMRNTEVIEQPAQLETLTQRYTQESVDFINRSKNGPFFLYLPHTFPHIPLAASPEFMGKSGEGVYGDVVQELDWSVGRILQALKDAGVDDNTLVMFSSDNGPWYQGSPGRLRGRKGDTYEGGFREPFIARFPGWIPAGQVSQSMATTLDILPTVARLTGAALPEKPLDGVDIWPMLTGQQQEVSRDVFLYFNDAYLQAARFGQWKLHVARYNVPMFTPEPARGRRNLPLRPELYNVVQDPEESYDRSDRNGAIIADIRARVDRLIKTFPEDIVNIYNDSMRRKVVYTPPDALPVEDAP